MVAFYHVHHVRAVDIIVLQFAAIGPETGFGLIFGAKIKLRLEGIIKEDTVRYIIIQANIKGNASVQRILVPGERISICIPVL